MLSQGAALINQSLKKLIPIPIPGIRLKIRSNSRSIPELNKGLTSIYYYYYYYA